MTDAARLGYLPAGPATLIRDVAPPLALAVALVVVGSWHPTAGWLPHAWAGTALEVVASLTLCVRRPWPLAALAASVAVTALYIAVGYPVGPVLLAPFVGVLHVVAYERPGRALMATASGGAAIALAHVRTAGVAAPVAFLAVWVGLAALFVAVQTGRRAFEREARAGREWAERSREEGARRRLAEERLRVAREVHDVVGHSLAVISLQSGVAEHLLDTRPEEARAALGAIRDVSRQALTEPRAEVAALRGESAGPGSGAAAPGLSDLAGLVASVRRAGLTVTLDLSTDAQADIPPEAAAAAYRIVQESLTNVVRHAGATAIAHVRVRTDGMVLEIAVTDTGEGADSLAEGSGIAGMRERAEALGGSIEVRSAPGAGFAIRASLPLRGRGGAPS